MIVMIKSWPLRCECRMLNVVYFDIEECQLIIKFGCPIHAWVLSFYVVTMKAEGDYNWVPPSRC